jgi:Histidine kinase-, DNA gyrase B-, and HSP90-like ATPase
VEIVGSKHGIAPRQSVTVVVYKNAADLPDIIGGENRTILMILPNAERSRSGDLSSLRPYCSFHGGLSLQALVVSREGEVFHRRIREKKRHQDQPSYIAGARTHPQVVEIGLFRVLQESLTNVHRHSRSPNVDIRIDVEDGQATLGVRDFGRGIASDQLESFEKGSDLGVGLAGMRERVNELGGTLQILPEKPGTLLTETVPIRQKVVPFLQPNTPKSGAQQPEPQARFSQEASDYSLSLKNVRWLAGASTPKTI